MKSFKSAKSFFFLTTTTLILPLSAGSLLAAEVLFTFDAGGLGSSWKASTIFKPITSAGTGPVDESEVKASAGDYPNPTGGALTIRAGKEGQLTSLPQALKRPPSKDDWLCFWLAAADSNATERLNMTVLFKADEYHKLSREIRLTSFGDWQLIAIPLTEFSETKGADWTKLVSLAFTIRNNAHLRLDQIGFASSQPDDAVIPEDSFPTQRTANPRPIPESFTLTSTEGREIVAKVLNFDGKVVEIEMPGRPKMTLPAERLSPSTIKELASYDFANPQGKPSGDWSAQTAGNARENLQKLGRFHQILPNIIKNLGSDAALVHPQVADFPDPTLEELVKTYNAVINEKLPKNILEIPSVSDRLREGRRELRHIKEARKTLFVGIEELLGKHIEWMTSYKQFEEDDTQLKFMVAERLRDLEKAKETLEKTKKSL